MNGIQEYIESFIAIDNKLLEVIAIEQKNRTDIQPSVGLEAGKILGLLIRLINAKRVLEFGSCIGYSTIWLAETLRYTGGKLISIEYDENLYEETKKNIFEAGLSSVVELVLGDAQTVVEEVIGPFDIVLQDSSKELYPKMLEKCISITRKNGLIIADDTLFKPMGIPSKFSEPVHSYNEKVFRDERLYSTILPIGDGVTVSVKLTD